MDNAYSKSLSASASEQEALNYQRSASHVASQTAGHSIDLSQDIIGYARSHGFSDADVSNIMSNEQKREEFIGGFFKEKYASIESDFSSNKSDIESSYKPSSHNIVNNTATLSKTVFDAANNATSQEINDEHIHESRNSLAERHAEFSQEVISKTNEHNKGYNPFWKNDKRTSDKE